MEPITVALIVILITLLTYATYKAAKVNKYWEERGIAYAKPLLFFGNSAPIIFLNKNFGEHNVRLTNQFPNEDMVGMFDYTVPMLVVKSADLIEKILIKDFMHFTDRGVPFNKKNPIDLSLFSMTGKEWRAFRYKLTPLFTTGKLKAMYDTMDQCGDALTTLLDQGSLEGVEMKEILGRFAMDVIGSCAFGIDTGNLAHPDNEFRRMGKKAFEFNTIDLIRFFIVNFFPKIAQFFNLTFTRNDVGEYFCKILRETVEYRRKNNVNRNDFLQLLMVLKDKGFVEIHTKDPADDYLKMEPTYSVETVEITEEMMIGQAFTFLTAGFEAAAATVTFALYELAHHPEVQDKVQKEVLKCVGESKKLTYDSIRQMDYLEQCVKETLRKYPPVPILMRKCTKEYTLPNGTVLKPGEIVIVSARSIHYDPLHYPDPKEFRPERFDPDQTIHPCAYIPFGNGPRICIAMRFAMMEISYSLAKLLMNYRFKMNPKSKPLEMSPKAFISTPRYPVLFDVTKI